jgi:hypothetical protein
MKKRYSICSTNLSPKELINRTLRKPILTVPIFDNEKVPPARSSFDNCSFFASSSRR